MTNRHSTYVAAWFCFLLGLGFGLFSIYHLVKYPNIQGTVVGLQYDRRSRFADLCPIVHYKFPDGQEWTETSKNGAFLGIFPPTIGKNINLLYDPKNRMAIWANTISCLWLQFLFFSILIPGILVITNSKTWLNLRFKYFGDK